ncbi:hypothetical protein AVEN_133429-1 [Araneus ventricosus]|uniref:Uncharacterized protein n=1 Tax=Araneus ventricosus TaxID=182803 RepID=A0A4Y2PRD6_ARAVE|nr:hypothetical protein AVEN_133429-1 [Araneus ventricosus]
MSHILQKVVQVQVCVRQPKDWVCPNPPLLGFWQQTVQFVQAVESVDYELRKDFSICLLQHAAANSDFAASVLFTNDSSLQVHFFIAELEINTLLLL